MGASPARTRPRVGADNAKAIRRIRLRHGEAVWAMANLGFQGAATSSTFYEYIKSLRKFGIPFGKIGLGRRGLANYSYCHLMELALVLTTRVYYFVPDAILGEIIEYRQVLYRHYRRAYLDRDAGIGAPITASVRARAGDKNAHCFRVFVGVSIAVNMWMPR
ncbi:hypothetical protein [Bradyrhizobium tropiciagri]|uniref:hypothetical protein n=1 Tax=Bradyrhizobium tropiciagri TaxID=312253 RepID=UPI00067B7734|nr:hypothetical protein [Bradyrhizobium tropiciagri]